MTLIKTVSLTYPLAWLVFSLVVIFLALHSVLMFVCRSSKISPIDAFGWN